MRYCLLFFLCVAVLLPATKAQQQSAQPQSFPAYVLMLARIFDGESAQLHEGWAVVVRGPQVESVGPLKAIQISLDAQTTDLAGLTLMPGLIQAHSHVSLHAYGETVRNTQGHKESFSPSVAGGTVS